MYKLIQRGETYNVAQRVFWCESEDDRNKIEIGTEAVFPDIAIIANSSGISAYMVTGENTWVKIL